jgi:hypothetical protein
MTKVFVLGNEQGIQLIIGLPTFENLKEYVLNLLVHLLASLITLIDRL